MSLWPKTREQLNEMINRHFDTSEYKQFSVKPHTGSAVVKAQLSRPRKVQRHTSLIAP